MGNASVMKYRNLLLLVLLTTLLCLPSTYGQDKARRGKPRKTPYKRTNKVDLDLCYDLTMSEGVTKVRFVTLLPKTLKYRQRIYGIKYSPEPTGFFSENGNLYAEYIFESPEKQIQIKINIKAKLFRYDLATARKKIPNSPPKDPNSTNFLKHETNIEKDDPRIQQIAKNIKGSSQANLIKNIQDYVVNNMDYHYDGRSKGALYAVENKSGQCAEYADLFVAICRAKGLPARVIVGYTTEASLTPKHAWAEVYLQRYGWVPFDPTWADVQYKSAREFHYMHSAYLYLTHIRNDEILHNYNIWLLWRWGGNVEIKDSIVFK